MTTEGGETLTKKEGAHKEGEEHLQRGGGKNIKRGGKAVPKYVNPRT